MEKSIRVQVLGRTYSLFVEEEHETLTRDIASFVDAKMQAFKRDHPEQSEITAAVITALAVAEELFTLREDQEQMRGALDQTLSALTHHLDETLSAVSDAVPGTPVATVVETPPLLPASTQDEPESTEERDDAEAPLPEEVPLSHEG